MVEIPAPRISYEDYYKHTISVSYAVFIVMLLLGIHLILNVGEIRYGIIFLLLALPFLACGLLIGDKWLKKQIMVDCKEKLEFLEFIFGYLKIEQLRQEAYDLDPDLYEKLCRLRNNFFLERGEIVKNHLKKYNSPIERYRYLLYKNRLIELKELEKDLEKFLDIRRELMKIMFESRK
jgi:hypothetical protein